MLSCPRPAAAFHRTVQNLDRCVETIPFCNQQSNYLFGLHHRIITSAV
jgi:hypothetical protein